MNLILFVVFFVICASDLCASEKSELQTRTPTYKTYAVSHERVYKKYLGCYRDNAARMFKRIFDFKNSASVDHCVDFCMIEGYVYAGLQFNECFCGNTFPKDPYLKVNEDQCYSPCEGARNGICGGTWANSVYETGNQIFVVKKDGNPTLIENEYFWSK